MRRSTFHKHRIAFADCDPAQIVFFANYFKWFDTSRFGFFVACGVPSWRDTAAKGANIGTPLVNATATFLNSATYGEDVVIESCVEEWRTKSFVMRHVARRGDTILAEGEDIRVFAIMDPEHPTRIRAALCELTHFPEPIMPRSHTYRLRVEFGDCDPAQITFYPNFLKWMDIAALHFFNACGIESSRRPRRTWGIIGAPLVGASAKFVSSQTYPEAIEVDTSIAEISGKAFVLKHVIRRGDTVLAEGEEKCVFGIEDPTDPKRIKAVAIPESLLAQWQ